MSSQLSSSSSSGKQRIVVLVSDMDRFSVVDDEHDPQRKYMLEKVLHFARELGHEVIVHRGMSEIPEADIAILHVDLSVVDEAYAAACKSARYVINGAVRDITKRNISKQLLARDDPWDGQVIVKSDLNCGGGPEFKQWKRSRGLLSRLSLRTKATDDYSVYANASAVPSAMWDHPDYVVERLLTEQTDDGWVLRVWIFMGEAEFTRKLIGSEPVVKGRSIFKVEGPSEIPDELRDYRARVGFDFGKFDFCICDGRPVLFDTNKTPGVFHVPHGDDGTRSLADGLIALANANTKIRQTV
ncbi:MAG: hypothetical protein AAGF28_03370 [Pseudomonadota bacterium]